MVNVVIALLCLLLGGSALQASEQRVAAVQAQADIRQVTPLEPPSPLALKATSLGFTRAAADVLWLSTIQYFGGGNPNERYSALPALLRTVVTLDPDFEYPYLFAGLILPLQGDARSALELLDAGQTRFPQNGLMPYYAGAIAKFQLSDNRLAADYWRRAAQIPGVPRAAAILAGVALTESDDRELALAWWEGVINSTDDPAIKARATAWRDHLQLVLQLEEQLRQKSLTILPDSPLGLPLRLNPTTGQIELDR